MKGGGVGRNISEAVGATVLILGGFVLLIVACGVYEAFVLRALWSWFVARPFGLPGLSLAGAYGLTLIKTLLFRSAEKAKGQETEIQWGVALFTPAFLLLLGWLVQRWLP